MENPAEAEQKIPAAKCHHFYCVHVPGYTPLMKAIMQGHVQRAHMWIEAGVDVNVTTGNGRTALLEATSRTPLSLQVVEWLLEAGTDPNISDKDGIVPLHYAARYGLELVVEKLLHSGADVNRSDNRGKNSFDYSCIQWCASMYSKVVRSRIRYEFKNNQKEKRRIL